MNTDAIKPVGARRPFATLRVIAALVLREMSSSYGRTRGGYLWAILEPVGGILLLTVAFSLSFRAPPIGTSFAMFYATGVVPFLMYTDIAQKVALALSFSRPLLVYPSVTFFDALMGRLITNMLSGLLVGYIIFAGLILTSDTRTDPQFGAIMLSLLMAGATAFGIGTLNCYMFSTFPLWAKLWGVVNRPLFLLSCVLFPFDAVPQPYRDYLWYNPLVHAVGQMRRGLYPYYSGDYVSPAYVFGLALVLFAVGFALLLRHHRTILNDM